MRKSLVTTKRQILQKGILIIYNCIRNRFLIQSFISAPPTPEILKYIALLNYNIALFIDQNNLMLFKKKTKKQKLSCPAARPAGPAPDGPFSCQTFACRVVCLTPLMSHDDLLYCGGYAGPDRRRWCLETSN